MKILITGACGFVGSSLARTIREHHSNWTIFGVDNLSRRGSENNLPQLRKHSVHFQHADLRSASDVESFPEVDWIIDAAAHTSVLAGLKHAISSRQLIESNLGSTINLLEFCKQRKAGFILLSTSRVYSIASLAQVPLIAIEHAFRLDLPQLQARADEFSGLTERGINESFSTRPPLSLYGTTKQTSETLAIEYGAAFDFPVWINRCGILAGGGQFGRGDQGIFSFWIHSHRARRPLHYSGFGGFGYQVRDCLHPRDLATLVCQQMQTRHDSSKPITVNVSGGAESATSLAQLTRWCDDQFGSLPVASQPETRPFDLPWIVLDSQLAQTTWSWKPTVTSEQIFAEIADHANSHPEWMDIV